jgi:hypothetical protein
MAGVAATLAAVALGWRLSSDSGAGARRMPARATLTPAAEVERAVDARASSTEPARAPGEASRRACASTRAASDVLTYPE